MTACCVPFQTLQRGGMPYSASEALPNSASYAPAPEPSAAHYAAMFQPAATDQPMQSTHQVITLIILTGSTSPC